MGISFICLCGSFSYWQDWNHTSVNYKNEDGRLPSLHCCVLAANIHLFSIVSSFSSITFFLRRISITIVHIMFSRQKWSLSVTLNLTLFDHMDYSLPGSSIHGIFQARILECVAISFSRRSSQSRDRTQVSTLQPDSIIWAIRETPIIQDSETGNSRQCQMGSPQHLFSNRVLHFFSLKISKLESKILTSCQVLQFKLLLIWIELLFAETDWDWIVVN